MTEQIDSAKLIAAFNAPVDLTNVHACLSELQLCSSALTYFDHLYAQALSNLDEAEDTWANVESEAALLARKDAPKTATAVEIKARIRDYVIKKPSARQAWDEVQRVRRQKATLERHMRTAEKRGGFAQSAQNGHDLLRRAAG